MVSTVLVPISAEAQDFKRSFWLHSALAQATETRQAPFTVSLAPGLNSVIGNAAMAGIGLSVVGALLWAKRIKSLGPGVACRKLRCPWAITAIRRKGSMARNTATTRIWHN